ncbi:MAG: hypothetical protein AAF205_00910 [Pseudomonadota bacterium]
MPAAATIRKFAFEQDFDRRSGERRQSERHEPAAADEARAAEDLIRKEAFAAGRETGRREMANEQAAALGKLAERLGRAVDLAALADEAGNRDIALLALAIADRLPTEGMSADRLADLLKDAGDAAHVRITVAPGDVEFAEAAVQVARETGDFTGRISVGAGDDMSMGDLCVDWGAGGFADLRQDRLDAVMAAINTEFPAPEAEYG